MSLAEHKPALDVLGPGQEAGPVETPFRRFLADFFESHLAKGASAVLLCIVFVALFAPWISPQNPYDLATVDVMDARQPPGGQSWASGLTFWLGSDGAGRDMVSAIFYGLRTSLFVGVASGLIAEDCLYVLEVMMSRWIDLTLQLERMNSRASQSRSSGCVGGTPLFPKLPTVLTMPCSK